MRTIFVCVDDMGAHFVCRRWCTQRLRVGNSRRVPTSCILAARLIVCLRATRPTDADVEDLSEEDFQDLLDAHPELTMVQVREAVWKLLNQWYEHQGLDIRASGNLHNDNVKQLKCELGVQ